MNKRSGLVYSTDQGRHCPDCNQPRQQCRCQQTRQSGGDGIIRLQRQTKGRAGKPVVIITGIAADELKAVAKTLKRKCGVGGTVEDDRIIIQGDKRDDIKRELEATGHVVRLSGG